MKKRMKIAAAAAMTGIVGFVSCFAGVHTLAIRAAEDSNMINITLTESDDGTKYQAVYNLALSDIPAGKKLTLVPDDTDKIGTADLQVSFSQNPVSGEAGSTEITFTSTGFSEPGDYSAAKNIYGYLSDDYTADYIPVMNTDFDYDLSDEDKTITLTKYNGSDTEVVVYPQYYITEGGRRTTR